MKILVAVKRVIDYSIKVRVKPDGSGVETSNVKMSINPFDEIALEEAVRIKEKGIANEVVVVAIGGEATTDVIRYALALGADRGIHIVTQHDIQSLQAAKILMQVAKEENPDLIITGKQAIDDDANQTGQMLAALLGIGQATFASKLEITDSHAIVTREIDGGHNTVKLKLPAVVTTDLRLNEPRYPSLPNIMKAKTKPITKKTDNELGVDISSHIAILKVEEPAKRKSGIKVKDSNELIEKLRNEAKVI